MFTKINEVIWEQERYFGSVALILKFLSVELQIPLSCNNNTKRGEGYFLYKIIEVHKIDLADNNTVP